MEAQKDFKYLFELFNTHKVKYMIVGGYALAYHGVPRYTGDIDIYVKPDSQNAESIMKALDEFGFGSVGLTIEDFENQNKVIQLGVPPVRIDIITSVSGVSWKDAFLSCVDGKYGDVPVKYIGLDELIINKRTTGRKKDLSDLEALGED
jgi:hypothetical protein